MGITDSWAKGRTGLHEDTHDRGIMNEWEPISKQLKAEGSPLALRASELIESMAGRLELPKEPMPSARGVIVLYEPHRWKDGIEMRDQSIEYWSGQASELQKALERARPWYRKVYDFGVLVCAAWVYRKGPMG